MSHLSLETIARIVDDGPSVEENRHLDACATCRAELDAMVEDVHALKMLPDVVPTVDRWDELEGMLVDEGLLITRRRVAWYNGPHLMQAAAAVVLFLGGTMAGRMMMGTPAPTTIAQPAPSLINATTSQQQPPAYATTAQDPALLPVDGMQPQPAPASNPNVTLAANGGFSRAGQPRTVEEAAALLRQTEDLYLTALTRYAELATQSQTGDPVARLAALQSIVMTTQAALNQAPTDPVINGYHLTALAQRDAALRQVATTTGDTWY
ncbi:MAG TPA: hypothetical protein VK928_01550 [Longimicrobiales bacterium]|nr:hypothetical protein [Longimicrobiales bacterium]